MKKIKLPLEMANGAVVRTLEELKANWDLRKIITYYSDGRLVKWLKDRYYDELAQQVENLDCEGMELQQQLSDLFGMKLEESQSIDVETLVDSQNKSALLQQYTSDEKIIENVDNVAFNQDELNILAAKDTEVIYLCGDKFDVTFRNKVKKYVGIGPVLVTVLEYGETSRGIPDVVFENVEFATMTDAGRKQKRYKLLLQYTSDENIIKNIDVDLVAFNQEELDNLILQKQKIVYLCGGKFNVSIQSGVLKYIGIGSAVATMNEMKNFQDYVLGGNLIPIFENIELNAETPDAMYQIAVIYGGREEIDKAFFWHSKAAENGSAMAQLMLGYYYTEGKGCVQDDNKAFELYLKSAEQGNAMAQEMVGLHYREGLVVTKDEQKAFNWLSKAAENGLIEAKKTVAGYYYHGIGTEKDTKKAFELRKQVAENGVADFERMVGLHYYKGEGVEKNWNRAFEWISKAEKDGDKEAKRFLSMFYFRGIGCPKNSSTAVIYLREAALAGDAIAQYNMAECYRGGIGCEKDFFMMLDWYKKAVQTDVNIFMEKSFKNLKPDGQNLDSWKIRLIKVIDAVQNMWTKGLFSGNIMYDETTKVFSLVSINSVLCKNALEAYGDKCGLIKNQIWFLDNDTIFSTSGSIGFAMDFFGVVTSRKERIWFSDISDIWIGDHGKSINVKYRNGGNKKIYSLDITRNDYKNLSSNSERDTKTMSELNQMFTMLSVALKD